MKLLSSHPRRRGLQGNILIITLVTGSILAGVTVAFLSLTSHQNYAMTRSYTWNSVFTHCESGVEEALAHMNQVGAATITTNINFATNGWSLGTNGVYRHRQLPDGGSYSVAIITNTPTPEVECTAYLTMPTTSKVLARSVRVTTTPLGTGARGLTSLGTVELIGQITSDSFDPSDPNYSTLGRYDPAKHKDNGFIGSVHSSITGDGGDVWGSVATGPSGSANGKVGDMSWMSNALTSGIQPGHYNNDLNVAFPDLDPPYSSGSSILETGGYATYTNSTVVASTNVSLSYPTNAYSITTNVLTIVTNTMPSPIPAGGVMTNSVAITTNSTTFPSPMPSGPITTNTTSTISGPFASESDARSSLVAGTYTGTPFVFEVNSGTTSQRGYYIRYNRISGYTYSVPGTAYSYNVYEYSATSFGTNDTQVRERFAYVLGSQDYMTSSFDMSGQDKTLVAGDATLYVTGDFTMQGQSQIVIAPGASLKIYVGGRTSLAGNGIMNLNADSFALEYYGLKTNTEFYLGGNAQWTGIIYAPRAFFKLGGGGADEFDFTGAAIVGSAKLNGHFNFHYDERLSNKTFGFQFRVASWDEI